MHAPSAKGDDARHDRHAAHQMADLEFFLKIQIINGSGHIERLPRVTLHIVRHGARLVDDKQALAGGSGVVADMIACLFQRLLDLLDLVADRLTKGLSGMRTHDLLMAKEGVGTIVHQHCAAKGGVGCKRQAGELPPHDVCQTQACQIRQFQIRCALKDMDGRFAPQSAGRT